MEKFDAIVIGAGPSGSTAAAILSKAGMNVLLLERGNPAGSKNVSGGILYTTAIKEVFPDFINSAPLERAITDHHIVILGENSSTTISYRKNDGSSPEIYSVLRADLDRWFAKRAEEFGATVITGITVDEIKVTNGRAIGIRAGQDELLADILIIAEGARRLLINRSGLQIGVQSHEFSLGIKEIISLPENVINERFQCDASTGVAYTLLGHTGGVYGGGFIYTNKSSLSLGVVIKVDSLVKSGVQPHTILDCFKAHPLVSRLIQGGRVEEYSAQIVPRGKFPPSSKIFGNGYVVVGSAAQLLLNNIFTLRGMDFAIISGAIAAKAILEAREEGGKYDAEGLSRYETYLKQTSIYRDWEAFKNTYYLLENKRIFEIYPDAICNVLDKLFHPNDNPTPKILNLLRHEIKGKISLLNVFQDAFQVMKGIGL
ncbi:MAG: FAD-dependent oxidoreductase [Anaerolineales bacterium]